MKIIGLGHYSRTGKDTFANAFIYHMHRINPKIAVVKQSLAWKLKQVTHDLYAWAGVQEPAYYETKEGAVARDIMLPALGLTPVELWVAFGTKAVRNNVYERTWLDYLLKSDLGVDIIVIPDVRFPNEAEAITNAGGLLIKVVRPGYGPRPTVADQALICYDRWDYIIGDSGRMDSLDRWAMEFANHYGDERKLPYQSQEARRNALMCEVIQ